MSKKETKVLAIDVGNSRIKLGLFQSNSAALKRGQLPGYITSIAINLDEVVPWEEIASWKNGDGAIHVSSVILGGVNPRGRDKVLDGWPKTGWPQPTLIDNPFVLPIKIDLNSPRTVGVDRLLNAIAGNIIRGQDQAMIIIDSGTATTVDVISAKGAFEGGAILPGYQLGALALHQYTALLPHISNQEMAQDLPPPTLGKNTRDALRSGLFWGQLGGVRELVNRLCADLPDTPEFVITGGAGRLLAPHLPGSVKHEPFLALQGLVIVGQHMAEEQ